MTKCRDAFGKALAQAVTLIVAAAPVSPTMSKEPVERGHVPSPMKEARTETFQAIAISRHAERFRDAPLDVGMTKRGWKGRELSSPCLRTLPPLIELRGESSCARKLHGLAVLRLHPSNDNELVAFRRRALGDALGNLCVGFGIG